MKTMATTLTALLALAAGAAFAADDMKKADGMMKKESALTLQECKDHMAMAKKDGTKKDAVCADMMKQDAMKKDDAMMKKEEPMKK